MGSGSASSTFRWFRSDFPRNGLQDGAHYAGIDLPMKVQSGIRNRRGTLIVIAIVCIGIAIWLTMAVLVRTDWIRKNRAEAVRAGEIPGREPAPAARQKER